MKRNRTVRPFVAAGFLLGGTLAATATWVFINSFSEADRLAAAADGFPLWSVHQLPFILPEFTLGGCVGALMGWGWFRWRTAART